MDEVSGTTRLAHRLRELRTQRFVTEEGAPPTVKQLAMRIGEEAGRRRPYSRQRIQDFERLDRSLPPVRVLSAYARIFGRSSWHPPHDGELTPDEHDRIELLREELLALRDEEARRRSQHPSSPSMRGDAANVEVTPLDAPRLHLPEWIDRQEAGSLVVRSRILSTVDRWLHPGDERDVFLLVGPPGSGKTSLMLQVVDLLNDGGIAGELPNIKARQVVHAHFCRASHDASLDPVRFVERLAEALAGQWPAFRTALQAATSGSDLYSLVTVPDETSPAFRIHETSSRRALDRAVLRPLELVHDAPELTLVVDALDEALLFPGDERGETLLNLVARLAQDPSQIHSGVKLLATTRPDRRVVSRFRTEDLHSLQTSSDDDIRRYAEQSLPQSRSRGEIARKIARASSGNFLYARHVVESIRDAHSSETTDPAPSETLPPDLEGVYRSFLWRELGRDVAGAEWTELYRPILSVLTAAQGDGLTRAQIAAITGIVESQVERVLQLASQFLHAPAATGPFRIYHESFREFLSQDDTYNVFPSEGHARIGLHFHARCGADWAPAEPYALTHTARHLLLGLGADGGDRSTAGMALVHLFEDAGYIVARCTRSGVDPLLAEVKELFRALHADPGAPDIGADPQLMDTLRRSRSAVQRLITILDREAPHLRRSPDASGKGFIAQQLHNRATDVGADRLAARLRGVMRSSAWPHLAVRWRVLGDSSAHRGGPVQALAVLPGDRIVTGAADGQLRVWDLERRMRTATFGRHERGINALGTSGDLVVSGSSDCTARGWDYASGEPRCLFVGHESSVNCVAVTRDGQLLTGSGDGTVRMWDLATGKPIGVLFGGSAGVWSIALADDEGLVVAGTLDGSLLVCRRDDGKLVNELGGHSSGVWGLAAIDRRRVLSASGDGTVRVWDVESATCERVLHGGGSGATCAAFDGERGIAASGWVDGAVRTWDIRRPDELNSRPAMSGSVWAVAFGSDGRLVAGLGDGTTRTWAPGAEHHEAVTTSRHGGGIWSLAVTTRLVLAGSGDGSIMQLNIDDGRRLGNLAGHDGRVNSMAMVSPHRVITGSYDGTARTWDLRKASPEQTLVGHAGGVWSVEVLDQRVATGSVDGKICIWSSEGTLLRGLMGHCGGVWSMAALGGGLLAAGTGDGTVLLWDVDSGELLRTVGTGGGGVWAAVAAFRRLVTGSEDGRIRLWDVPSLRHVGDLAGHRGRVEALAADGRLLASGSEDGTVRVWDGRRNQIVATVALDAEPSSIAVDAHGSCVVVGDTAGSIHAFDLREVLIGSRSAADGALAPLWRSR